MEAEKTELQELKELFSRAQDVNYLKGGKPVSIVQNDQKLVDLEGYMNTPTAIRGKYSFSRQTSFIDYVKEHKVPATRIYVTSATVIIAVINHAAKGDPQWNDHQAELTLKQTPQWNVWKGQSGKSMNQRDFAQFIEDNASDIIEPKGAELLDLIRTIKASQTLELGGEVNEKGDLTSQIFELRANTKTGARLDIELPGSFKIALSPYEDGSIAAIECRLRFKIEAPKMSLSYEIRHIDRIEREAVDKIAWNVRTMTEVPVWYGTPVFRQ